MEKAIKRFACSACGRCCSRSPEIELGEAAALADVFVFRLMFRIYWLPKQLKDFLVTDPQGPNASEKFYSRKRLLSVFAARERSVGTRRTGKLVEYSKYLTISAITLETKADVCSALNDTQSGIYDRRPLSCQSVPFHYSRTEASPEEDLAAFVTTPGYRCDTGEGAPIVLEGGRIVAADFKAAREAAMIVARKDKPWAEAITRRLKAPSPCYPGFPTLDEVEANASFAATTVSMRVAWQIATDAGMLSQVECNRLVELQLRKISEQLKNGCSAETRETLAEMQVEYREHLHAEYGDRVLIG